MTDIASLLGRPVSIRQLSEDMSVQDDLFLRLHRSDARQLDTLPLVLQPLVLCLRYFIHHSAKERAKLANHEVVALIVASLKSLASVLGVEVPSILTGRPDLRKRSIHMTAQWQGTMTLLTRSHRCLGIRQAETRDLLIHVYDGLLVHRHLAQAKQGANLGKLLEGAGEDVKCLFCNVYHAVTNGLEKTMNNVFDYNVPLATEQETKDWFVQDTLKKKGDENDATPARGKSKIRKIKKQSPAVTMSQLKAMPLNC